MVLGLVTAMLFGVVSSVMIPVARSVGLTDKPCSRKAHMGEVPLTGGLSIYITVFIVWCFGVAFSGVLLATMLATSIIVATGIIDDRFDLPVLTRIVVQIIASGILVVGAGVEINSLGNLLNLGEVELGVFSVPFTIFAIMVAMNAYNMIDGIDGLLGSIALVTFGGIAVLSVIYGHPEALFFSLVAVFALIPFLYRNLQKTGSRVDQIFMGDAGSMFIGLLSIWLIAIMLSPEMSKEYVLKFGNMFTISDTREPIRAVTALWLVTIPIMDMVGIMVRRMMKGQSPLRPDRNHLHHIFMRAGFSPREALVIIFASACFWAAVGILLEYFKVADVVILLIYLSVFVLYLFCLKFSWRLVVWFRRWMQIEKKLKHRE
ncbi:undecaprenyl-phosphate alpha-N-acetylglucosaminyl 1-phosphate transferase [Aliidiomarina shirensis]|nr:undecaprenyl-phosphate alpha-N-acetylglucosaminyl 1-phosphate transferase [Aliidiomarina shirensis]